MIENGEYINVYVQLHKSNNGFSSVHTGEKIFICHQKMEGENCL